MSDLELPAEDVERLRSATPTYPEVGATRTGVTVRGYRRITRTVVLGSGRARFEEAAHRLLRWDMHRRAGLHVRASSSPITPGAVAILRLGRAPLTVDAPVRVVYVVDEPQRRGFAYGTLPGHPESGEEAFVVELHDDASVTLTITAFSRPATLLARLGAPVSRLAQAWITRRYLRAL